MTAHARRTKSRCCRALRAAGALALCALAHAPLARADAGSGMPAAPDVAALREFVITQVDAGSGRVEIEIGRLDPRLRLRPCTDIEPFVPSGARLYGRTHLGMRCRQAGGWTVYLPVNVRVYAQVPVAARTLTSGQTLSAADLVLEEREVSLTGAGPVPALAQLEGRVLARGYAAGQAIVTTALRPNPVVANGDPVKVVVQGAGFAIATAGVALSQADDGQPIRVRLSSGRTVQGVARTGKLVEMRI